MSEPGFAAERGAELLPVVMGGCVFKWAIGSGWTL